MEFSEESEDECPRINIFKPKKRPTLGRIRDVSNKLKVKGYVTGEDCKVYIKTLLMSNAFN